MKKYKGTLKCIQFKDRASFDEIYKLLGLCGMDDDRYNIACKHGIYVNSTNRVYFNEYLCDMGNDQYIKLSVDFMAEFKKYN